MIQQRIFPQTKRKNKILKLIFKKFQKKRNSLVFYRTPKLVPIFELNQSKKTICDPASTLNRLRKFFELFLSDGLNSEFAYTFGLKDA